MDDLTRAKAAREELVEMLLSTMEQANELATRRRPNTRRAIERFYLRLEGLGRDATSLSAALRILETRAKA